MILMFIIMLIIEIVLLVLSIKTKEKKYWIELFLLEFISIVFSYMSMIYYNNLGGFDGLGVVASMFFIAIYGILTFISVCIKIVKYEKHLKYSNPLILITALIFISVGILSLGNEILENLGKVETNGTVIGFRSIETGNGTENWPIISFLLMVKKKKAAVT